MATGIAIAGAVAAIVGTGVSVYSSIRAAKAQKKARKVQSRRYREDQRRQRRQQLREGRIRRAAALNTGVQIGGDDSSSLAGGLASLSSQVSGNLATSHRDTRFSETMSGIKQDISDAQQLGELGGAVAKLGGTAFSNSQGIADFWNKVRR